MTEPSLFSVPCADPDGGHRMAYWQWGDPASPHVVLCVHGLTRQGRDFDVLARALLAHADGKLRVVCPDVVGRGRSDWLRDPQGYQVPQYAADMLALLAQLQHEKAIDTLDYVGTSMGGLIGMALAGSPRLALPAPIHRLVLNDVGPVVQPAAIARIAAYVGRPASFASVDAAADAMWLLSSSFGPHTPEQWRELTRHLLVSAAQRSADGSAKVASTDETPPFVLHYDPAIAVPIRAITPEMMAQSELAMWALYDAITAPTLLVRGAVSDLLLGDTAHQMTQRGPRATLVEFDGVGHAPTLIAPAQSGAVVSFLLA